MCTRATRIGGIAVGVGTILFAAIAAVPIASSRAAEMEVQIEPCSFAPPRPIPDTKSGGATRSWARLVTKGWIALHRPDGEIVYIRIDQIVLVTSAKDTGAAERARSKIQLLNGHSDVRESVEEVVQSIDNDISVAKEGM